MQTAFAVNLSEQAGRPESLQHISVAISAGVVAVRNRIEAIALLAGAHVVPGEAKHDILLVAVDSSTPLGQLHEIGHSAKACAIWVSGELSRNTVLRILRAGMAGIVSLESTGEQFQAALQAIQAGLQVIQPEFTRAQNGISPEVASVSGEELTNREQQVLGMMAAGLSNKEIASRLAISTHTVKFHISSILGKLGAGSRTEAVSIGIRSGRVAI